MDRHTAFDEMSDLEKLLLGLQPSRADLDSSAMLFAAGRQSVARNSWRLVWPTVAGVFALLAVALALWAANEHSARLALVRQIQPIAPQPELTPSIESPLADVSIQASERLTVLHAHQFEFDESDHESPSPGAKLLRHEPLAPILRAGQHDVLLEF